MPCNFVQSRDTASEIARALGLDPDRRPIVGLTIRVPAEDAVTVDVEEMVDASAIDPLKTVLQGYVLVPKPPDPGACPECGAADARTRYWQQVSCRACGHGLRSPLAADVAVTADRLDALLQDFGAAHVDKDEVLRTLAVAVSVLRGAVDAETSPAVSKAAESPTANLSPCPRCGQTKVEYVGSGGGAYAARCVGCGYSGFRAAK